DLSDNIISLILDIYAQNKKMLIKMVCNSNSNMPDYLEIYL
ncbi:19964_t:CDS:1, partial [Funneliformis geosporum]